MDKENIKGAPLKVKGKLEEVAGKVVGDKDFELHGRPTSLAEQYATPLEQRRIR